MQMEHATDVLPKMEMPPSIDALLDALRNSNALLPRYDDLRIIHRYVAAFGDPVGARMPLPSYLRTTLSRILEQYPDCPASPDELHRWQVQDSLFQLFGVGAD